MTLFITSFKAVGAQIRRILLYLVPLAVAACAPSGQPYYCEQTIGDRAVTASGGDPFMFGPALIISTIMEVGCDDSPSTSYSTASTDRSDPGDPVRVALAGKPESFETEAERDAWYEERREEIDRKYDALASESWKKCNRGWVGGSYHSGAMTCEEEQAAEIEEQRAAALEALAEDRDAGLVATN